MDKSIVNSLKTFWESLFEKKEYDPEVIEAKRKAIEKFCETQNKNYPDKDCLQCWLYYKIPWPDECHDTDEEVDQTYQLLYGDKPPEELNRKAKPEYTIHNKEDIVGIVYHTEKGRIVTIDKTANINKFIEIINVETGDVIEDNELLLILEEILRGECK